MKKNGYTISEMSKLLGVTTHMLRHYEKVGIIHPVVDEENGYRYYSVIDTRRFNLSRSLMQCGLSLEQCAHVMSDMPLEEFSALVEKNIQEQKLQIERSKIAIAYLRTACDTYRSLSRKVDRVWVECFPPMWRLNLSQNEKARQTDSLLRQQERWLSCLPAVFWVSRIERATLRDFSQGTIDYGYGLMCYERDALALGFEKTPEVEEVPGGDYLMTIHRKSDRGPFTWEDIRALTDYLKKENISLFGDAFSHIVASRVEEGREVNYHRMFCKIYS